MNPGILTSGYRPPPMPYGLLGSPSPIPTIDPRVDFDPRSISGILHWWDSTDASTLLLVNGAVSRWTSKAGALVAASQSVANNRPILSAINGLNAMTFDGANDGFDFAGTARTDETWIVAAAQTADQSGTRAMVNDGGDGHGINAARGSVRLLDTSWGNNTDGVGRLRATWNANPATPYGPAVTSVVRSAAGGGFVFVNGTQRSSAINGASSFTTSGSVTIRRIGYYTAAGFQWQGWIGDIVCYNRALSASERLSVERWMGAKWGIAVA